MAEKFRRKMEGQLAAGTYENQSRKHWASGSGRPRGRFESFPISSARLIDVYMRINESRQDGVGRDILDHQISDLIDSRIRGPDLSDSASLDYDIPI